jgi:hypothetical protein
MIHIVMAEMRQNQQPLSLTDLSQRLQIDHSVLEGIVTTLVQRGYMVEVQLESPDYLPYRKNVSVHCVRAIPGYASVSLASMRTRPPLPIPPATGGGQVGG